jgi:hemoglobin
MAIYDEIGGAPAVTAAVDLFYDKVTGDPRLSGYFTGVDLPRLKGHQRAFIAAALGATPPCRGRDMGTAHTGLGITDGEFDAVVGHLVATLEQLGVPAATIGQIAETLAPLRDDIVTRSAVP